jgi:hypothetical protein
VEIGDEGYSKNGIKTNNEYTRYPTVGVGIIKGQTLPEEDEKLPG